MQNKYIQLLKSVWEDSLLLKIAVCSPWNACKAGMSGMLYAVGMFFLSFSFLEKKIYKIPVFVDIQ